MIRWQHADATKSIPLSPPGRAQNIFDTTAPLAIVIPADLALHRRELSAALRLAHNIDVYLKLDVEIILDTVAVGLLKSPVGDNALQGNIIVHGGHDNAVSRYLLNCETRKRVSEFSLDAGGKWHFRNQPLVESGGDSLGLLFTHTHPLGKPFVGFVAFLDPASISHSAASFPSKR